LNNECLAGFHVHARREQVEASGSKETIRSAQAYMEGIRLAVCRYRYKYERAANPLDQSHGLPIWQAKVLATGLK
jgi:hypothetical protein